MIIRSYDRTIIRSYDETSSTCRKKTNSKKRAHHDLEPPSGRDGLERREATRRHIGELQVLRHGQVAREADAGLLMLRSSLLLLLGFLKFSLTSLVELALASIMMNMRVLSVQLFCASFFDDNLTLAARAEKT